MVPAQENTLYLPIKQVYFDQIIAGTKKEEYREIKTTTTKKYLQTDPAGLFIPDTAIIDPAPAHNTLMIFLTGNSHSGHGSTNTWLWPLAMRKKGTRQSLRLTAFLLNLK